MLQWQRGIEHRVLRTRPRLGQAGGEVPRALPRLGERIVAGPIFSGPGPRCGSQSRGSTRGRGR